MPNKRYSIIFSGIVQGVGFRYTAFKTAASHNINGWVQNQADGTVKAVIEGDDQAIDEFMDVLSMRMGCRISGRTMEEEKYTGEFSDFRIL